MEKWGLILIYQQVFESATNSGKKTKENTFITIQPTKTLFLVNILLLKGNFELSLMFPTP